MDIREQLVKNIGGEVVNNNPQEPNVIDLTGNENQPEESKTTTQEQSNVVDLTEESSLNNEEQNVETAPQKDQVDEISDDELVLEYLSEKLGTNISSFDELINSDQSVESNEFASDQLKVINDYIKNTGRSVQDYINTQTVDLANVSDDAVLKEYIRLDNPNLTDSELNDYLTETYKTDKEKHSTREMNAGKVKLTKDAKAARDYFNEVKNEYAMPLESQKSSTLSEEDRDMWIGEMSNEVDDLDGISFPMNDKGEEYVYQLDDSARDEIKGYNANLDTFFDKYVDEQGAWDFDKLNTDMYILNNIDKIVRGVANQYRSKGTENVINEIKNPSFAQDKQEAPQKQQTTLDMLRKQILG